MEPDEMKVGGLVRLVGGGPTMTAIAPHVPSKIPTIDGVLEQPGMWLCRWFGSQHDLREGTFHPATLVAVEPEPTRQ